MVILHIATIKNNPFNGVCVIAPKHVKFQGEYAEVALLNMGEEKIIGVNEQFLFSKCGKIESLPSPFNKPDFVVFHECYRISYLPVAKWLKDNKIPYVIIPHGELTVMAQKKKWLKKKLANLLLFKRFINGAKAIQCLSEREMALTKFGKKRFVGTNGVEIAEEKKSEFSANGLKFIYIGRLEVKIKGLDLMILAVSKIKEEFRKNSCSLSIYGPDLNGRFAEVESLIKQNGVEDIVFLNREVIGEEKKKLLLSADVFIQTSRTEGMPLGILEALGYGIPVLITEGTTLSSQVQEKNCGWGCSTSVDGISRALEIAIKERERLKEKSERAREFVFKEFEWLAVAEKTVEQYKLLGKMR